MSEKKDPSKTDPTTSANDPSQTTDSNPNPGPTDNPPNESTPTPSAPSKDDSALKLELERAQKELEELRKKEREREEAELSELEKVKKRLQEAEERAQQQTQRNQRLIKEQAVQRKAAELGAGPRQSLIARLINWEDIQLDESGEPVGVESAVKAVQEAAPELFQAHTTTKTKSTSATSTGTNKPSDRNLPDDEGDAIESERELGQAIARSVRNKKNATRL